MSGAYSLSPTGPSSHQGARTSCRRQLTRTTPNLLPRRQQGCQATYDPPAGRPLRQWTAQCLWFEQHGHHKSLLLALAERMLLLLHLVILCGCLLQTAHGQEAPRIISLHACTDIKYRFATTRITSHVINPTNQSREAIFDITLPNDAFISNFTLAIGGEVFVGRVEERGAALKKFHVDAKQGLASGGQVTQRTRETNKFRVSLRLAPHDGVTFNLSYQEILERRLGTYDHVLYINPGHPVEDMRVDVTIEENREITLLHVPPIRSGLLTDVPEGETNSLVRVQRPNARQAHVSYHPSVRHQQLQGASRRGLSGLFTVRYDVSRTPDAGELLNVNGYFVHFIAPTVSEPLAKDVLFILDTSTSMMWQKLGQLQDAMRVILKDLTPRDRFALMQFNSQATFWRRELLSVTPENIKAALSYVSTLKARGYTNIDSAFERALRFLNEDSTVRGENTLIIFLTDGRPTRGETIRDSILSNIRRQNQKNVTVYGLAFGQDADWPLVKRLASQNNGVGRRIYQDADAALQIHGFYSELSTLLLTRVKALYVDSEVDSDTLTKAFLNKYFNGSELLVAGKLIHLNQTSLRVLVQATGAAGNVNLTVTPEPEVTVPDQNASCRLMSVEDLGRITEKMWAYLTIRQMLQRRVGEDEDDVQLKQELKDKAVQLSLKYKFVTPVTSLVVRKSESEELAYLQEDDSDIIDETDLPKPEVKELSTNTSASNTTSTAGRGGGGGDPHFMVESGDLPYPLCFDVSGHSGDVFQLLRDPATGLTLNVELGEGPSLTRGGHNRTYLVRAVINLQDVITDVTLTHVRVNHLKMAWNNTLSVRAPGVWVMMTGELLRAAVDGGVEIDVTRYAHGQGEAHVLEFLNVEIQNEAKLSPAASGLLGQFVHKTVHLQKMKRRDGRLVAELDIRNNNSTLRHGRAVVRKRRDPFFGRTAPCLMVDSAWSQTLDHPSSFYRVPDIHFL